MKFARQSRVDVSAKLYDMIFKKAEVTPIVIL